MEIIVAKHMGFCGGVKRAVEMARSTAEGSAGSVFTWGPLIHNPQVVFLDEPFEGVDPTSSRNIKDAISFAAGKNCTFFITSHSLEIMDQIIDSFAIISHGEIVYDADIDALRAENKSLATIYFEHIKNDITGDLGWLGQ